MIGFVTWPPFSYHHYYKGGQVTKPIILVKIYYKLLYVIQANLALDDIKVFGHTYLFTMLASQIFTSRVFLFSIAIM